MESRKITCSFDKTFQEVSVLETILKFTKATCENKEINSVYYSVANSSLELSQERTDYLNMLNIALEKVSEIKACNTALEEEVYKLEQYSDNSSR